MWFLGVIGGLVLGGMAGSFWSAVVMAVIGGIVVHAVSRKEKGRELTPTPTPNLRAEVAALKRKVAALEERLQQVEGLLQAGSGSIAAVAKETLEPNRPLDERTQTADTAPVAPAFAEPESRPAPPLPASSACETRTSDALTRPFGETKDPVDLVAATTADTNSDDAPVSLSAPLPPPAYTPSEPPRVATPRHRKPPAPPSIPFKERLPEPVRNFIYGGNTLVKLGVLILFLGLAFLLRYTAERVTVPVELRYAGVALAGAGVLALGWFLRLRRRDYALIMQGMGVGVFYLTTLAAMKFHGLLSAEGGFGFMAAVSFLGAALAVMQNAPVLAVIAALEGFATPVLLSTGGNHMTALMTYLVILDVGIVLIAWFNAWRVLNVIGFVGTFTLATGWAHRYYTHDQYLPAQAFLVLFFLIFTAVGVLFARRTLLDAQLAAQDDDSLARKAGAALRQVGRVDSALVFGTPLTAFGLQYLLSKPWEFGPAFSALALCAFYLLLARLVFSRHRTGLALLAEGYVIVAVIFGTLVVPLGFEGTWTSAAWAVEGAGMYWLGIRQQRAYSRAFAYLVLLGAGYKLLLEIGLTVTTDGPLLHGSTLGPILLALSALSIWRQNRQAKLDAEPSWEAIPGGMTLWLGMAALTLLPWQWFAPQTAAAATAVLSLLAYGVARRFDLQPFSPVVFALHALAVASFVPTLHLSTDVASSAVLVGGWKSMLCALTIAAGILLTAAWSLARICKDKDSEGEDVRRRSGIQAFAMAVGASVLHLALLFVVSLQTACAATAVLSVGIYLVKRRSGVDALIGVVAYLQALAVAGFVVTLHRTAGEAGAVLESGWHGSVGALVIAASILLTAGLGMAAVRRQALDDGIQPEWTKGNALAVLGGTALLHLATLFALSIEQAAAVWPVTACLALWIALRIAHSPLAGFAAALHAISAGLFLYARDSLPSAHFTGADEHSLAPFAHLQFWTPLIVALAAWRCADWIRAEARYFATRLSPDAPGKPSRWSNPWCARTAWRWLPVVWGLVWWSGAWLEESGRVLDLRGIPEYLPTASVAIALITSFVVATLAQRRDWAEMGRLSALTLPALILCACAGLAGAAGRYVPSAYFGAVAWPLALLWHLRLLRAQDRWLVLAQRQILHVAGFWFFLLLASREGQARFSALSDDLSSWAMLGWVLVPVCVFWGVRSSVLKRRWPLSEFRNTYMEIACLPVAAYLLLWCFVSNLLGSGNAAPLPYLPILNPLELGQWLVLTALLLWWRALPETSPVRLPTNAANAVAAGMGWFLLTAMVLRACHHWGGVEWDASALFHSRLAQASLSIAWALMGVSTMLLGNRRASRSLWAAGAVLLGVVVLKLFAIELADRGGLYRIVSFIGVGVLLLVVGYFAPVPARASATASGVANEPLKETP